MPYTDLLPLSGAIDQSRHTSALGAEEATPRAGAQTRRLLFWLARGPATDWELHHLMRIERTTVTARRRPLCVDVDRQGAYIEACSGVYRPGPTGTKNTLWRLTTRGQAFVAALREAR